MEDLLDHILNAGVLQLLFIKTMRTARTLIQEMHTYLSSHVQLNNAAPQKRGKLKPLCKACTILSLLIAHHSYVIVT